MRSELDRRLCLKTWRSLIVIVQNWVAAVIEGRDVYLLYACQCQNHVEDAIDSAYERALVFLLLRLRRRTRFFLHLALILSANYSNVSACCTSEATQKRSRGNLECIARCPMMCFRCFVVQKLETYVAFEMSVGGCKEKVFVGDDFDFV